MCMLVKGCIRKWLIGSDNVKVRFLPCADFSVC